MADFQRFPPSIARYYLRIIIDISAREMLDLNQCLGYRVHQLPCMHYDDIADARLTQNREIISLFTKENSV